MGVTSNITWTLPGAGCDPRPRLLPGALAVLAPWPAARPTLALLQLLLGPANAALPGLVALRVLDPADELVARQRGDVSPGVECHGAGEQRCAQIAWEPVHDATGDSCGAHASTVASR